MRRGAGVSGDPQNDALGGGCDGGEVACCFLSSPCLRGEVGLPRRCEASSGAIRVRGYRSIDRAHSRRQLLTPAL
jgi:hypothetical protein